MSGNAVCRGFSGEQNCQSCLNGFRYSRTSVHIHLLPLEAHWLGWKKGVRDGQEEIVLFFYLFLNILFIFRERGREGEREGEKHQCERETSIGCLLYMPPPPNPGMCPDQESNQQPFALWDDTQTLSHTSQDSAGGVFCLFVSLFVCLF